MSPRLHPAGGDEPNAMTTLTVTVEIDVPSGNVDQILEYLRDDPASDTLGWLHDALCTGSLVRVREAKPRPCHVRYPHGIVGMCMRPSGHEGEHESLVMGKWDA